MSFEITIVEKKEAADQEGEEFIQDTPLYKQTVENLDLKRVIAAINEIDY